MKISTFFQNKAENQVPVQSKLFTSVGTSKSQKQTSTAVTHDNANRKCSHIASFSIQRSTSMSASKMESVTAQSDSITKSLITKHTAVSCIVNNTDVTMVTDCKAEQECIPETQIVTPVKPRCNHFDGSESSPDITAIPDTPESPLSHSKERKTFRSNRSFLRPGLLLGIRPGAKQGPSKIIEKPKGSLKTSLSLVSVQFNTKKDGCIDLTEQIECIQSPTAIEKKMQECSADIEGNDGSIDKEDTPTKCYGSVNTHTKRLAKMGSSPVAKRILTLEKNESSSASSSGLLSVHKTEVENVEKSMVKRVLSLMGNNVDSQVEMYSTKQRDYQLGITRAKKNKCAEDFDENDELLSEILNEIVSKPVPQVKKQISNLTSRPQMKIPIKKVSAVEMKCRNDSLHKCLDVDPLTDDDLILFKTLDLSFDESFDTEMVHSSYVSSPSVILGNPQCCCISALNGQTCNRSHCRNKESIKQGGQVIFETGGVNVSEKHFDKKEEKCPSQDSMTYGLCASDTEMRNDVSEFPQCSASPESGDEKTSRFYASDMETKTGIDSSQSESTSSQKHKMSNVYVSQCSDIKGSRADGCLIDSTEVPPTSLVSGVSDNPDRHASSPDSQLLCDEFDSFTSFENETLFSQMSGVRPADRFGRYKVIRVEYAGHDLVLELQSDINGEEKTCILQDFWADSHVNEGNIVHILGEFNEEKKCYISDRSGLIIIHPDTLLSGTSVVSSIHCMRRSVLSEKFKGCDDKNIHMLFGSIIHCLFQQVLKNNVSSETDIMKQTASVMQLSKFLHEMYSQNVSEAVVLEEIKKYVPPLMKWLRMHTALNRETAANSVNNVQVCKIQDIEENIWSPRYGIKGKIDLTVDVKIQREKSRIEKKVIPLELKTGKTTYSIEHTGQVTLYSMMSSDRRDDPEEGLLLYLKDPDMKLIPVKQDNKRGLIQLRNEIAYYLSQQVVSSSCDDHVTYQSVRLPPPINNSRMCARCPQVFNCAAYLKTLEQLNLDEKHAMSGLVSVTLSHLTREHLEYFTHWCLCLDLEARDGQQTKIKDIWCKSSIERESDGDCLSGMVILKTEVGNITDSQFFSEGTSCLITFKRSQGYNSFSKTPVNTVGLSTNDSIAISTDDGRLLVLCTGIIRNMSEYTVQVVVDRDNFHVDEELSGQVFRLDRCDNFNTLGYLYTNLSKLMAVDQHRTRLRELIIDKKKPEFQLTMSKGMIEKVKSVFKSLNKPQKTVILKVLMSKDYVLVKGYPGTGKTSTIVALVRILYLLGQSVLLTSYTHSAVDNILLKLKKDNIPFLRLGRLGRIHKAIHPFAVETLTANITRVADLRDFYASQKIVATSCLGTNHSLFSQRKFDVCIVDEASQVLQSACLGPLFSSDRFVLVGDPQQLPPIVQSREARNLGMSESLFVRLDDTGATFDLNLQYRMNKTIMQLTNELVYDGALKCGSTEVADSLVNFPHVGQLQKQVLWIQKALAPVLERSAVFLDTKQVPATEINDKKGLIRNETEAALVICLLKALLMVGKDAESIGVIAPYRNQVKFLQQSLLHEDLPAVEVNTVDQYQGRDKDVIIISFVRSQSQDFSNKTGELLKDLRRLNVSITRARHKLILIGDLSTLCHYQPLEKLISIMTANQQIIQLPEDAHLQHSK
ncbi:DNA replication ATP-dependent helicase/nuclease DNA2-like [Gigantopelta aegis]|uniref:DNA replication ATP-dependent helicase/nuclease DNA2-like n=1 Tax=Gigantopelta aegis TaxID=1735272 RepID=UPI001B88D928|nr:DNA replication ATP-dependent helicase/nuclease DNA2-like [Gigantopelta aegis]